MTQLSIDLILKKSTYRIRSRKERYNGMSMEQKMYNALLNYGAINENWRIKIIGKENQPYSDWVKVTVEVYKPRCRKPCTIWTLATNCVKEFVDFEKSTFVYL